LTWFIRGNKAEEAIQCCVNLIKHNPMHHKTSGALEKFRKFQGTIEAKEQL